MTFSAFAHSSRADDGETLKHNVGTPDYCTRGDPNASVMAVPPQGLAASRTGLSTTTTRHRGNGLKSSPRVAIVHDYLTQRGGAERVVLSMLRVFPDAPLYTAVYQPDRTYPEFAEYDVRPLWTNRIGVLRRDHRRGLLLYPLVFSAARIDADLVLCSSSGFAHGVRCSGRKIVYCYTPPRWLYDEAHTYLASWPSLVATLLRAFAPAMRRWDKNAATTADAYLTTSRAIWERINHTYGIDSEVIAPPVHSIASRGLRSMPDIEPGFLLCVSRLLAYKNVAAVTQAFKYLPDSRLIIVGTGPEYDRLHSMAGPNVTLVGRVDDAQLAWLYSNSAGVVAAGHEDFGMTPLEAASYGKPVAVLGAGGFLDTVIENRTGIFFATPNPTLIAAAILRVLNYHWDLPSILAHAEHFSELSFADRLRKAAALTPATPTPAAASDYLIQGAFDALDNRARSIPS